MPPAVDAEVEVASIQPGWTRWRPTHDFAGYRVRDCERNNGGACKRMIVWPTLLTYRPDARR